MTGVEGQAQFRVVFAGPHVSFQDGGRPGNMRFGVPRSGPMDLLAHAAANVALGKEASATAIEVSAGGVILECIEGGATLAITGGDVIVEIDGVPATGWNGISIGAGQRLAVRPGSWGSWSYLGVLGDLEATRWLDSTATHSMSGFGGGLLHAGTQIVVSNCRTDPHREGEIPQPDFAPSSGPLRVVIGPQDHHFEPAAVDTFLATPYRLTDSYDRMGVRLAGASLPLRQALAIPSEPIVRGSVQVGGDEVPTVLLADHQTTGGYPKIATVISADLDRLVQYRPGDGVRFTAIEPPAAVHVARAHATKSAEYLRSISAPGRTLAHRLMRENLITAAPSLPASASEST